jgi:hypothetical protein
MTRATKAMVRAAAMATAASLLSLGASASPRQTPPPSAGAPDETFWVVLRDGARLAARGRLEVRPPLVRFTTPEGRLASLRLAQVDVEATRRASAGASPAQLRNLELPTPSGAARQMEVALAARAARAQGRPGSFTVAESSVEFETRGDGGTSGDEETEATDRGAAARGAREEDGAAADGETDGPVRSGEEEEERFAVQPEPKAPARSATGEARRSAEKQPGKARRPRSAGRD